MIALGAELAGWFLRLQECFYYIPVTHLKISRVKERDYTYYTYPATLLLRLLRCAFENRPEVKKK